MALNRYGEPVEEPGDVIPVPQPASDVWEARARAIADCGMCDGDGYVGTLVCDHTDHRATNAVGVEMCRAVLEEIAARKGRR